MSDRIRNISVTGEHLVHADARLHPLRIDELAGRNTLISMSDTPGSGYICAQNWKVYRAGKESRAEAKMSLML